METETWHLHPALAARVVGLRPPRTAALSAFARVPLVLGRADRPARLEARVIEAGGAGLAATGGVLAGPAWDAMLASGEALALEPSAVQRGASGWVFGPALGSLVAEARSRLAADDALLGWVRDASGGGVAVVIDALARRARAGLAARARDRAWLAEGRGDRAAFCALAASAAALEEPASAGAVGLAVAAYRAAGRERESLDLALGAARAQGPVFASTVLGAADAFAADLGLPRA